METVDISTTGLEKWRHLTFAKIACWCNEARAEWMEAKENERAIDFAMRYGVFTYNSMEDVSTDRA